MPLTETACGLRAAARDVLIAPTPDEKLSAAKRLQAALAEDSPIEPEAPHALATAIPGRPGRPHLVEPGRVAPRSATTAAGRAALLHAVAHIEFNAINLAADACWRFDGMPQDYYRDWAQVTIEEAHHFALLRAHLRESLATDYGDFEAHDGLWQMCAKTAEDVLARMALVPRTLEARGLDATPPMRAKLAAAGDTRAVQILDIILRDEIGHVAIGNRWYAWLCEQRGLDPLSSFDELCLRYGAPRPRGPLNVPARRQAGFSEAELQRLQARAGERA